MEGIELDVVDYLQVGVTTRKCLKILPNNEKRKVTQKVVLGDKDGVLQCFGLKKRDVTSIFKLSRGPPITKVELGGALGTPQDKIFVASGAEVRGYSRKGKKFLDFNSNLTESIANLYISGSDLVVSGLYIYNHFSDCVDQGYYLSNDKINDLICLPINRKEDEKMVPVLACNDQNLRVLKDCKLDYEVEVSGTPQCIAAYRTGSGPNELVYGTADGKIGHVLLNDHAPDYKWLISNNQGWGEVSCLSHYDITGDGLEELLVGREDGHVEIYAYDDMEDPFLKYSHAFNESITSIQGGVVASLGFSEIVTSTFSGWVTSLTTEHQKPFPSQLHAGATSPESTAQSAMHKENLKKLDSLRSEIGVLESKANAQREKHIEKSARVSSTIGATPELTKAVSCHVNDNFRLNRSDASYHLSIEVQTAIDFVVIQADVPVDLLDLDNTAAVISRTNDDTASDDPNHNYLLVTYRCQQNASRLEIKFRSIEGHHGHVQAYIVPRLHPKTALLRRYPIRPLSLHQRTHFTDENRPMNLLKLTGPFSIAEIHSWVSFCLPDLPDRPPAEKEVTLHFSNSFLETQLECRYKKGQGIFRSENISTISILKDMLSKEATAKKIALNIHYEINEESIAHTLRLLHPKMDYQFLLVKKVNLLDALQELQTHEGSMDFLAPEYQMILENADELKSEFLKQPSRLERLYGMITDLYIDKFKFKGINVKNRVPQLLEILDNYELSTLIAFFAQPVYS